MSITRRAASHQVQGIALGRDSAGYRIDVQGLRAVAVLSVLLFHGGSLLPGGFVGVDIFFVISGFVITGLLLREWGRSRRISLRSFYKRRVLRLLPASTLMTAMTLVLSLLFVTPLFQRDVARAALFTVAFSSNWFFAIFSGGYFQPTVSENPFLHTWSLAVEEQFYLFFPLLLTVLLWRGRSSWRRRVWLGVAIVSVLSFALCLWLTLGPFPPSGGRRMAQIEDYSGRLAFYTPFTRAWEFGLGALVQIHLTTPRNAGRFNLGHRVVKSVEYVCLAVLALTVLFLSEQDFPGAKAALPTLATCGLLWAYGFSQQSSTARRLLESRAAVWLGDRSYSVYLWHWPLIVFAGMAVPGNRLVAVGAAALSVLPAAASYRFVEHPIHRGIRFSRPGWFAVVLAACLVVPTTLGSIVLRGASRGWDDPTTQSYLAQMGEVHLDRQKGCFGSWPLGDPGRSDCVWRVARAEGTILFIGDSHTGHLSEAGVEAITSLGYNAQLVTFGNCPFILRDTPRTQACAAFVDGSLDYLRRHPKTYSAIMVSNASTGYVFGDSGDAPAAKQGDAAQVWAKDSARFAATVKNIAPTLILLDVPGAEGMHTCLVPAPLQARTSQCGYFSNDSERVRMRDQTAALQKAAVEAEGVATFDPRPLVCSAEGCSGLLAPGVLRYSDGNHLTMQATHSFVAPLVGALRTVLAGNR